MDRGARIAVGCNIGASFGGIASFSLHGWLWGRTPGRGVIPLSGCARPGAGPMVAPATRTHRVPQREERDMSTTVLGLSADHPLSFIWSTHTDVQHARLL